MDNRVDLPGYKYFLDAETGERPACYVSFLNIERSPGDTVNGVLLEVPHQQLRALDDRERNYHRVRVEVDPPVDGDVYVYVGTDEARRRWTAGTAAGTCVVDEGYLQSVEAGFRSLGGGALRRFVESTAPPACPVRPLLRRDVRAPISGISGTLGRRESTAGALRAHDVRRICR